MLTAQSRVAKVHYLANGVRVLAPGDHVLCAQSGVQVPLDELRYWSVARQEAYAGAVLAARAYGRP